jgi:hypothetical protein
MGIEGAIPDDEASMASAQGVRALTTPVPEYPQASRFESAAPGNYRVSRGARSIERVVVHITDGDSRISDTGSGEPGTCVSNDTGAACDRSDARAGRSAGAVNDAPRSLTPARPLE